MRDNWFSRITGAKYWLGSGDKTAREDRVDAEAQRGLVRGMRQTGILPGENEKLWGDPRTDAIVKAYPGLLNGDYADTNKAFRELGPKVIDKHGNPYGGTADVVKAVNENTKAVEKTNDILRQQGQPPKERTERLPGMPGFQPVR
jgi:hypothetical protein